MKRGDLIEFPDEAPYYLPMIHKGGQYTVNKVEEAGEGVLYVTILGDDNERRMMHTVFALSVCVTMNVTDHSFDVCQAQVIYRRLGVCQKAKSQPVRVGGAAIILKGNQRLECLEHQLVN